MSTLPESFWQVIEKARAKDESASPEQLEAILSKASDQEIKDFARHFYQGLVNLNLWSIWGAGYVICRGMSDDSFHYFRSWIIGAGPAAYQCALNSPDALGDFIPKGLDTDELDNEELEYVPINLLESRNIQEDPRDEVEGDADDEPEGKAWNEETVDQLYPMLAKRFS